MLPASIDISLTPPYRDGPAVEQLAARLKQESGVASVEYPQEWVERLGLIVLIVEWIKWILAGVLFTTTFFIVGSTIKLAMLGPADGRPRFTVCVPHRFRGGPGDRLRTVGQRWAGQR